MQTHDSRPVSKSAMPSRRTFLKGALIAAATPAVAVAPLLPDTLGGLIASWNENHALVKAAEDLNDALWESPDRPPVGFVSRGEVPAYYHPRLRQDGFSNRQDINAFFDHEVRVIEWNLGIGMPNGVAAKHISKINEHREKMLAIYGERERSYLAWKTSSGYGASCKELDRLCDIEENLGEKILNYRCVSIEDVRLKAAHADRTCSNITDETARALLQSFLI